jgi:hypothetical protein
MALQQIYIDQVAIDRSIAQFNALLANANAAIVELETNFTVTFETYDEWLQFVETHPDRRPDRLKEMIAADNASSFDFNGIPVNIENLKKLIELPSLETLKSVMPQPYDVSTLDLGEFDSEGEIVLSDTKVAAMAAGHTISGTAEQKAIVDAFTAAITSLRTMPAAIRFTKRYLMFPAISVEPNCIRELIK